jgi:hypothetical protein
MGSIIKSSAFVDFDADSSGNASYINEDDSTVIARFISPTTGLHVGAPEKVITLNQAKEYMI